MTVAAAREFIDNNPTPRSSGRKYPIKDTISIPSKGFTRFRFRADNPGFWLLHCHYEWHLATGMGLIFQVGETDQMVPPPADFPKCGNYNPNGLAGVLTPQWIPTNYTRAVPANCHIGGHDPIIKSPYYIARRRFTTEILIGRFSKLYTYASCKFTKRTFKLMINCDFFLFSN